jgi:tetratricopeptide (TPR) repeat protein
MSDNRPRLGNHNNNAAVFSALFAVLATSLLVAACDTSSGGSQTQPATPTANNVAISSTVAISPTTVLTPNLTALASPDCHIAEDPNVTPEADHHLWLGRCDQAQGNTSQALVEFTEAIKLAPPTDVQDIKVNAYFARGDLYKQLGNYDHAIADYTAVTKLPPSDNSQSGQSLYYSYHSRAYTSIARTYVATRRYKEAAANFSTALDLAPEDIYLLEERGDVYVALGEKDKAIADYTQLLETDGKPLKDKSGRVSYMGLGQSREKIKEKLRALGAPVSDATPPPIPTVLGGLDLTPAFPPTNGTPTPQLPLPTATGLTSP